MKKIVLFSLLVLIFPTAALADTSESISDEMTTSDQELVTESTFIPENITNENQTSTSSETPTSDEPTVESETVTSEEISSVDTSSTSEEIPAAGEILAESATAESTMSSSETLISPAAVVTRTLSATPKTIDPKEIAEKTKPVLIFEEDYIITELKYPWEIREVLTYSKFKIDPAELSGYTDQELENAFTLLAHYSSDVTYMDWSGYKCFIEIT